MVILDLYNQHPDKFRPLITKRKKRQIEWLLICFLVLLYSMATLAQDGGIEDLNYTAPSTFSPTIRDAKKFSDLPEIKDSVTRMGSIKYGITSKPFFPKYQVQTIEAAKIQNEPLTKLYHSLLKVGYGPIYNMPYGEFWINNARSRESSYGAHLKHFSSTGHLEDVGYSGFSDNEVNLFGKKFYKKHTLFGDLNYQSNMVHYYGYDTSFYKSDNTSFTKQRYQLIEPTVQLQSHYADSSHINHNIKFGYYNYQNLQKETENRIKLDAYTSMFINKEKLNINLFTQYYNHKQQYDTLNDLIVSLNPSFEASGKKWQADVGFTGTLDQFKGKSRFYFYPQVNLNYNVYENMIIPYLGVNGGLIVNSFRNLSQENPYIDSTIQYTNTNNKFNLFLGLKGNLSSNTSYDLKASYAQYDSMVFFAINYYDVNKLYNRFQMLYDNTSLLTIGGQLKYQFREKINLIAKGNYYLYQTKNLTYAYQKPDYDITLTGIYNLNSKFIVKLDLFFLGTQWALGSVENGVVNATQAKQIKGWFDANLEGEYRYSKMLSFFARFNNIANQRYYRWENYPNQRFNFMLGLTFVPF